MSTSSVWAAADDQTHRRAQPRRVPEERGKEVPFEVVDAEERFLLPQRQPLGDRRADHEAARQSRPRRGGEGVHVREGDACPGERVVEQRRQFAQVLARGGLGHDAAVEGVQVDLRGDLAGEQFRRVPRKTATAVSSQEVSMARINGRKAYFLEAICCR